jgi:molybdopterin/thiamine biosynthesis adenylyltransferase
MRKNLYLIGNGSLGSFAAIILGRFAERFDWNLKFVDFDKVEEHNLQNQFFRREDIGELKPVALAKHLLELQGTKAEPVYSAAGGSDVFQDIVVVLVDSMRSRKAIFSACAYDAGVRYYVEARSGGDSALVYGFDPRDPDCVKRYTACLYDDRGAIAAPCATARQLPIIFLISAAVGELLARNEECPIRPNDFVQITVGYDGDGLPFVQPASYTDVSY